MGDGSAARKDEPAFPRDTEVAVSIVDLEAQLHDAWLDLDSLRRDGDELAIHGHQEWPHGLLRLGRFPLKLRATGVNVVEFEDDYDQRGILVCDARPSLPEAGLQIDGCIPATLRILGDDLQLRIMIAAAPTHTKLPFARWRPAADG